MNKKNTGTTLPEVALCFLIIVLFNTIPSKLEYWIKEFNKPRVEMSNLFSTYPPPLQSGPAIHQRTLGFIENVICGQTGWSKWSPCSKTCDKGVQWRQSDSITGALINPVILTNCKHDHQTKSCENTACPGKRWRIFHEMKGYI